MSEQPPRNTIGSCERCLSDVGADPLGERDQHLLDLAALATGAEGRPDAVHLELCGL